MFNRILIVPDKFKGSLTAPEVAEAISKGMIDKAIACGNTPPFFSLRPMADGGEGSLYTVAAAMKGKGRIITSDASDPLGRPLKADYFLLGDTAFIELAQTSGLSLLSKAERSPLRTSTYGFGQQILHAITVSGAKKIVLAIGGSATNDGGTGLLRAIGYTLESPLDPMKSPMPDYLNSIQNIDSSSVPEPVREKRILFEVACDVDNPLLGASGATSVYAPQKGALPEDLPLFEKGMSHWAQIASNGVQTASPVPLREIPGSGAAGGVGFALHAVLGASLISGWRLLASMMNLEEEIERADLVITGEGSFDSQSLCGKLPYGMAQMCSEHRKPLWLFCGRNLLKEEEWKNAGIACVHSLAEISADEEQCIKNAKELLYRLCYSLF